MERIHVTITPSMLLIVLPMVFLAATVDAISGGGGLISLPAYTMAGLSYDFAAGNNKFSSTFGTLTATVRYFRSGRLRVAPALCAVVGALPGSWLGTRTAMALGNEAMRAFCEADGNAAYLDITPFFYESPNEIGTLQGFKDLFVEDGLHLTDAGYEQFAPYFATLLRDNGF